MFTDVIDNGVSGFSCPAMLVDTYNALTINAIVSCHAHAESVLQVPRFWQRYAYRIGEHVYSLDDMEHGILRGDDEGNQDGEGRGGVS